MGERGPPALPGKSDEIGEGERRREGKVSHLLSAKLGAGGRGGLLLTLALTLPCPGPLSTSVNSKIIIYVRVL